MICPATPVHAPPFPQSGLRLPWVQAAPRFYGAIFASRPSGPGFALYTHGTAPDGSATKVLWNVRRIAVDRLLVVRGTQLDGSATFRQSFSSAYASDPPGRIYPSIVDIPSAGCWRLDLSTRGFKGRLVVRAVDP